MKCVIIKSFFFVVVSFFSYVSAVVVGSDSSFSSAGGITFLAYESDNKLNGFTYFKEGFSLETPLTTCTFDAYFPVSGTVDLNVGSLYLAKDLTFDCGTSLVNMGNIYGNGHIVKFSESVTTFTAFASQGTSLSSWQQLDSKNLTKDVNSVDWSYDDNYVVAARDGSRLYAYSFNGSSLAYVDYISTYQTPYSVRAHPSGYYFLIAINADDDDYNMTRVYKLTGGNLSLIDSETEEERGRAVDWSADGSYCVVGSTSKIRVYSFSNENLSHIDYLSLSGGEDIYRNAICWDRTGAYIAGGIDHSSSSKLKIYGFNGSTVSSKTSVNTGSAAVTAVDWSHTGSFIAVGTEGSSNQLRVYEYNSSTNTLTERNKISVGSTVRSVHWNPGTTKLLVGKSSHSGGTELRLYTFNGLDYSLTLDLDAEKTTHINSARWSHDGLYLAYGDESNNLVVYSHTPGQGSYNADSVILDNVTCKLGNNLSWKMATTVSGACTIDGGGKRVSLEGAGKISVAENATVRFKHMELTGVSNDTLVMNGDSASVIFEKCSVTLADDFDISTGSIFFDRDVVFYGSGQCTYSSVMASTIGANSTCKFDQDTVFSYEPGDTNRDLLYMEDETACLYLRGCTIKSTSTGMRFTRGTVYLDGKVTLSSDGTVPGESICFGDGDADHNVRVKILPGTELVVYGELYDNNIG